MHPDYNLSPDFHPQSETGSEQFLRFLSDFKCEIGGGKNAINDGFVSHSLDVTEQRLESVVQLQFTTRSRAGWI